MANTHDYLMGISSEGKAYWLKIHEIPEASRARLAERISKGFSPFRPNEELSAIVDLTDFSDSSISSWAPSAAL